MLTDGLMRALFKLQGKENYLLSRPKTGVVYIPEVVLEPAFWILFCLHSILLVGEVADASIEDDDCGCGVHKTDNMPLAHLTIQIYAVSKGSCGGNHRVILG